MNDHIYIYIHIYEQAGNWEIYGDAAESGGVTHRELRRTAEEAQAAE
jgi:hypothetical protein